MSAVLVIDAHPSPTSLCAALADRYAEAARAGASVDVLRLRELRFDPVLHEGYRGDQALEPDLRAAQDRIRAASHLVFVYPSWWGTYPALLKGFLDRTLVPGFAFAFRDARRWDRLLAGRSARLIVTMDWPAWAFRWVQGAPGHRAMANATLGFCGVRPVSITALDQVKTSTPAVREGWFATVGRAATADLRRLEHRSGSRTEHAEAGSFAGREGMPQACATGRGRAAGPGAPTG
ncbi:MAG: NAD(P)H-dependent oxidoreductase [Myxococcota bacterium]